MAQQHTGRRALFGGATALVAVAVVPSAGEAAGPVAPHPDAELIAACERFQALEWQRLRLYYGTGWMEDDDQRDEAIDPIVDAQEALMDAIFDPVAMTFEGLRARARAATIWDTDRVYAAAERWNDFVGAADLSTQIEAAMLRDLVGKDWLASVVALLDQKSPVRPLAALEPSGDDSLDAFRASICMTPVNLCNPAGCGSCGNYKARDAELLAKATRRA